MNDENKFHQFTQTTEPGPLQQVQLIWMKDVQSKAIKWLWPGHLARGNLEILTGIPEVGKSQLHCLIIACVTNGTTWPDGSPGCKPSHVIMLTAEDVLATVVKPRLQAAKADVNKVVVLSCIKEDRKTRMFYLDDIEPLRRTIREIRASHGDVALVTLDPITAYMGKSNSNVTSDVRGQLGPLKELAESEDVAISAITHPPKNATSQRAIDHFIGSQAFIAAARIGHMCTKEIERDENGKPEKDEAGEFIETGRYLFTNPKNNINLKMPTWAYESNAVVVDQDAETGEAISAPYIVWKEQVGITADQAVRTASARREKPNVAKFLKTALANGPLKQEKLIELAEVKDISLDQMKRAKDEAGVMSKKVGFGPDGYWEWRRIVHDQEIPF